VGAVPGAGQVIGGRHALQAFHAFTQLGDFFHQRRCLAVAQQQQEPVLQRHSQRAGVDRLIQPGRRAQLDVVLAAAAAQHRRQPSRSTTAAP
jgi:hypothetical protein